MAIIVDANIFCAFANKDDIHNEKSTKIIKEIISNKYGKPLTTDYVFDEILTFLLRRSDKKNAIEFGKFLLNSQISILHINNIIFQEAWSIFQKLEKFSFTDCTNIAVMKIFDIKQIATFDKEFLKLKNIKIVSQ